MKHQFDTLHVRYLEILLPLARGFTDFGNHVKTLSEAVGTVTSRIASVEQTVSALSSKMASIAALEQNVSTLTQNVNSLTARIFEIETNATSPVVPTRQDHGTYLDIVTAPQPLGPSCPMAQGHLMTVEIRGVDLILMEMTKVHSSFQRSMLTHESSALKIEETELENWCSNLLLLEADKRLPLLHLSCLFLVILLKCCNVFSLAIQQGQCVMAAFSPPRFFAAWRVEAPFYAVPVSMGSTLCVIFDSRR